MRLRPLVIPMVAALAAFGLMTAVLGMHVRAREANAAAVEIGRLQSQMTALSSKPISLPLSGMPLEEVSSTIEAMWTRYLSDLDNLADEHPNPQLVVVQRASRAALSANASLQEGFAAEPGAATSAAISPELRATLVELAAAQERTLSALRVAGVEYERSASSVLRQAAAGSAAGLLLLFALFGVFYRRAHRIAAENRRQARIDALTGLRNRRALLQDLAALDVEAVLAILDLDGFKAFNDTHGHQAGDELLARLGRRLEETVAGIARAYRLGGDEFCVVVPGAEDEARATVALAGSALTDEGQGVSPSYGFAPLPAGGSITDTLRLADARMYAQKAARRAIAA